MNITNKFLPIIIFGILSFVIMLPLLAPGYILTLDMITVPKVLWPSFTSPSFLIGLVNSLFNLIFPAYIFPKIILFLIFFLSGWGMYRLIPEKFGWARFFGGLLFSVNPFVYERVMAGHWYLLFGYALFPFTVSAVVGFYQNPGKRTALVLALLVSFLIGIVIHFSLIFFPFFIIFSAAYLLFHRQRLRATAKYLSLFFFCFLIFNANWIVPMIIGNSEVSQAIEQFDSRDLITFQSYPDSRFGLIFNLLSGYGFWGEANKYYVSPKEIIFFWPVLSLVLLGLSLYGFTKSLLERDRNSYPFIMTMVVMFLLALDFAGGIGLKSFANTVFFLYEKYPFLRGLREPQKLVGILMFIQAYLGSIGLYHLSHRVEQKGKYALVIIFFLLPFIYTPLIFGGFWGQLKPANYPSSWSKINQLLNSDKDNFLVLSLPWHQYMPFKFSHNILIANPAAAFFDKPVLSSRNYETKYLFTHEDRAEALHVEGLLAIERKGINLLGEKVTEKLPWGESLAPIGVKYIILAKDDDWKDYGFIINSFDLEKTYEGEEMILYKNRKWSADFGSDTQADPEFVPELEMAPIDN